MTVNANIANHLPAQAKARGHQTALIDSATQESFSYAHLDSASDQLARGMAKANIAAWIASSQHLKVGNGMPSYDQLEGRQLRALAAFLDSLR